MSRFEKEIFKYLSEKIVPGKEKLFIPINNDDNNCILACDMDSANIMNVFIKNTEEEEEINEILLDYIEERGKKDNLNLKKIHNMKITKGQFTDIINYLASLYDTQEFDIQTNIEMEGQKKNIILMDVFTIVRLRRYYLGY